MFDLTTAVEEGYVLLIESVTEDIDPILDNLLSRNYQTKNGKNYVILDGDSGIQVDPDFRLYLQCKLSNPHFRPETAAQCTIINFIVTESGLVD